MIQYDENGFTLLEVIVSLAIFSIIIGAIGLFMKNNVEVLKRSNDEKIKNQDVTLLNQKLNGSLNKIEDLTINNVISTNTVGDVTITETDSISFDKIVSENLVLHRLKDYGDWGDTGWWLYTGDNALKVTTKLPTGYMGKHTRAIDARFYIQPPNLKKATNDNFKYKISFWAKKADIATAGEVIAKDNEITPILNQTFTLSDTWQKFTHKWTGTSTEDWIILSGENADIFDIGIKQIEEITLNTTVDNIEEINESESSFIADNFENVIMQIISEDEIQRIKIEADHILINQKFKYNKIINYNPWDYNYDYSQD